MEHDAVVAFGRRLRADDKVILEATGNTATLLACLIAIPLGAAVITPNGNNGASLTAGGHIDEWH
jgi:hypothetical protein